MTGLKSKLVFSLKLISRLGVIFFLLAASAYGQQGGEPGELQTARVPRHRIPPAPPLTPSEALKTFKLPAGFRIELVASEPLVEMPVAIAFDPDGRIWVLEMRGFMPNVVGLGEQEAVGRVVTLEDLDSDGRMDKKKIFLEGLIMPRALALVRDGVLVAEPPKLWFCRDANGDGKSDEKVEVASDYGSQINPEHAANGLLWAMDNWIYSANHTNRLRNVRGKWQREVTIGRGQWGITQDDFGRLFFNSNSDQLRGDLIPSHYVNKVGITAKLSGLNVRIAEDQSVWPIRVTPGVNRAYQPKQLRDDGTLATFTAACGPGIYRGDNFPKEFLGNAFVCEPSGNLVKRNILVEKDGVISARNAYEKAEFLASTDERFRPVNVYTGPDGALYVVDMYHGVLQHRIYMTSYLRGQVEERGLDKPQNQGRIYRIVHESRPPGPKPNLIKQSGADLVKHLSHPNGWWRDTAQRLLVESADVSVVAALQAMATTGAQPLARLHALWTLDGLGKLEPSIIEAAMADAHPKIRTAAIRLSESRLKVLNKIPASAALRTKLFSLITDTNADVQIQLALTLGEIPPEPGVKEALLSIQKTGVNALARDAAAFGLDPDRAAKPAVPVTAVGPPLTAEQQARFEMGKALYEATCLACHQPHGRGQEGLAPSLVGSDWVTGSEQRLARVVLHGLRGPIKVNNQTFELDMPALGVLDDDQIAAVLTYVRREWGHAAACVEPNTIKRIREATATREDAWTEEELLKIP